MTGFLDTGFGASDIDVGDIGHSLRFRSAASAYLSRTITTDVTSTYFAAIKRGKLGVISPIFDANIKFNANDTLTAFGLTTTAVFRDPTSWLFIHVSNGGLYINGVSYGAVTTSALTNPRIGYDGTNYFDGYIARIGCVAGSSSAHTNFGYLNTEINEWVSKSQSAVKAVVDAGGTNSFMLDFDDAASLTTLGNDFSSKNNDWTLNNFSLTAGTTYDHMLDVPGNSYATGNPIKGNSTYTPALYTNGNLQATAYSQSGAGGRMGFASVPCPNNQKSVAELTFVSASTAYTYVGICRTTVTTDAAFTSFTAFQNVGGAGQIVSNFGSAIQTGLAVWAANDVFRIEVDLVSNTVQFYKNNTAYGTAVSITNADDWIICTVHGSGTGNTAVFDVNFGQAPLHASATYHSAAGGYFRDAPTAGFKALCQANLPTPAILNPTSGFVAVTDTEANIDATLATARTGWTDFVDIKKNRAAVESWAWQFSHDSTNEYAIGAASSVHQAKRAMSGANTWIGYSIQIGATYGTAAGSVSHTNGAATTVTHNIGVSSRQLILLFLRSGAGTVVPVYHPDLTSGELLDLCSTAADAASTAITTVATNSFQIGSATATGTYDYLVCSELSGFFDLGTWTGNNSADGPYVDNGHKTALLIGKGRTPASSTWAFYDSVRDPYNVVVHWLVGNGTGAEGLGLSGVDFVSSGTKLRANDVGSPFNTNTAVYTHANWASVAGKFSLGR